jgi:Zn-dependent alcohol dehydrogenase
VRGIVFVGDHKTEITESLDVRDPGATEVAVRIVNAGVCHSDISVIDGTIPWPAPAVLGHEGAGVVEEVGSAVTTLKPGDHVVLATIANCGMCAACNTGHPTWCRQTMGVMDKPFTFNGEATWNFAATSVFAERTVVKETQAVRIDDDVPLSSACLIGCGVLTGAGAALNRARVQQGESAAVFGVGGVGLNVIQGLRIAGASRIIAVDTIKTKEPLARRFGATDFIDATDTDVVDAIRDLLPFQAGAKRAGPFGAGGVNWSFECVGNAHVLRSAIDVLDWGGNCVIVGVPAFDVEFSAVVTFFTHVDRGLLGCRYGSARPHHDIPLLVELYKQGRLLLDELVSATYPLEQFGSVVADLHEGKLARGVLAF